SDLAPRTLHNFLPRPRRSPMTAVRVSNGVRVSKSWLIWKVRTKPRAERLCTGSEVMSWPSRWMVPLDGRRTPVNKLTKVVLPAPFGPIKACRAPLTRFSETLLVAIRPPNFLVRFLADKAYSSSAMRPSLEPGPGPHKTVSSDTHQHHQEQTYPEGPELGCQIGQHVMEAREHHGSDNAAVDPRRATDNHHQQHIGRPLKCEGIKRTEVHAVGLDGTRCGGNGACQGVGQLDPAVGVDAYGGSAQPIVTDQTQAGAEWRIDDSAVDHQKNGQDHERVVRGGYTVEGKRKQPQDRCHINALQTVGAPGKPGHV